MSQFTQEQEVEIVKRARDLTATIQFEEEELGRLQKARFKDVPNPPTHTVIENEVVVQPAYPPEPTSDYKFIQHVQEMVHINNQTIFWILLVVACITPLFWVVVIGLIIAYRSYKEKLKEKVNELKQQEDYKKAVAEAERIAEEKRIELDKKQKEEQKVYDEEYEKAKNHYDTVILPQYNEERRVWSENQSRKIAIIEEEISLNKEALDMLYETSKLISATYRALWILSWLYEDMSTSDHDIRYATELLDRDRQRVETRESGQLVRNAVQHMEKSTMQGMRAIFDSIEYGNYLQEESIEQLSKARRDMNIGNLIGTVQRHNTNKMLQQMLPKKK